MLSLSVVPTLRRQRRHCLGFTGKVFIVVSGVARVPKSEVQEIFDKLNAVDKGKALGYMQSLLDMHDERL